MFTLKRRSTRSNKQRKTKILAVFSVLTKGIADNR